MASPRVEQIYDILSRSAQVPHSDKYFVNWLLKGARIAPENLEDMHIIKVIKKAHLIGEPFL
jgi:hypothetical protein